jgi:hypothetical protein
MNGQILDAKYRIDSALGRGGMGSVYLATHLGTGREVALKVLLPELTADEAAIERFRREARTAGQIRHPNVVDVTDFGFADVGDREVAYLVMELLRGCTLRALLEERGALPPGLAIDVLGQVCRGVAAAHALDILHRDLKPENIHLQPVRDGEYHVKVLDFGIAKLVDANSTAPAVLAPDAGYAETMRAPLSGSAASSITEQGAVIGTPRYIPPEQWLGRPTDARSDVYSLGVIAYELLTGAPPFVGTTAPLPREHTTLPPPPLLERTSVVTSALARVVESALAKDPADRPASAAAFASALRAAGESSGHVVRRALGLSVEHYATLLRGGAPLTVTMVCIRIVGVASGLLTWVHLLSERLDRVIDQGAEVVSSVAQPFLIVYVAGRLVPVVEGLTGEPGRARAQAPRPPIRKVLLDSWSSAVAVFVSVMVANTVTAGVLLAVFAVTGHFGDLDPRGEGNAHPFASFVTHEILAVPFGAAALAPLAACGPVIAVERLRGVAAVRRSAVLMRSILRTAYEATFTYIMVRTALVVLVIAAAQRTMTAEFLASDAGALVHRFVWLATTVVFLVVSPFTLSIFPLLYLRARALAVSSK